MSNSYDLINLHNKLNSAYDVELPKIDTRNYYLADYQYELLCEYIKEFQDSLDDEHEVGLQLACFGQSILLHATNIRLF